MSFLLDQTPPASSSSAGRCWTMGSDLFNAVMPHHQGIQALWETKWKFPVSRSLLLSTYYLPVRQTSLTRQCAAGMYPFHDGKFADFEPVFKALIRQGVTDGTSADYTHAFTATAEALAAAGDASARQGNATEASSFYLRSACVYRIARFPYITGFSQTDPNDDDSDEDNSAKWKAWQAQKDVYMRAGRTWSPPVVEVDIFHTYRQGMDRDKIPVYVRAPATASPEKPCPLVILMTGLDGYRPDNTQRCDELTRRGWATLVVEIPGTADCPADPADPSSPDRLWSSVLEWAQRDGRFDMVKVMVWGLSAGAYYAVRVAHTHADMLRGVVAQGAGCHYWFDPEWLEKSQGHEYPFG